MFNNSLSIKMTSQSLWNFCTELRTTGESQASNYVKIENDFDVIFMFNM